MHHPQDVRDLYWRRRMARFWHANDVRRALAADAPTIIAAENASTYAKPFDETNCRLGAITSPMITANRPIPSGTVNTLPHGALRASRWWKR